MDDAIHHAGGLAREQGGVDKHVLNVAQAFEARGGASERLVCSICNRFYHSHTLVDIFSFLLVYLLRIALVFDYNLGH